MSTEEVRRRIRLHIGEPTSFFDRMVGATVEEGIVDTETFAFRYRTGNGSFVVRGRLRGRSGGTLVVLRLREERLSWKLLVVSAGLGYGFVYFGDDNPLNWALALLSGVIGGVALPRLGVVDSSVVNAVESELSELLNGDSP